MKRWIWMVAAAVVLATVGIWFCLRTWRLGTENVPHKPTPVSVQDHPRVAPTVSKSYSPPEVSSPELSKLVDRRLPFEERVHGTTTGSILGVKDERDLKALVQVLSDPEEDDTVRHEIAYLLIRSEFTGLEAELFRILENPAEKERFRGWAVQHLGKLLSSDPQVGVSSDLVEWLRQLLTDRHIEVRREALLALAWHDDPKAMEAVVEWLQAEGAEADSMRDMAIRCAHDKNLREHIPTIRPYARSTNDVIRIAAIVALSQWGDEESRPAMEEAAKSAVVRVQRWRPPGTDELSGTSVERQAGAGDTGRGQMVSY